MNISAEDENARIDALEGRELNIAVAMENGYSWYAIKNGDGSGRIFNDNAMSNKRRDTFVLLGKDTPELFDLAWDYFLPEYTDVLRDAFTLLSQMEGTEPFKFFSLNVIAKTGKVTAKFDFTSATGECDGGDLGEQICTAICRAFLKWKRRNG